MPRTGLPMTKEGFSYRGPERGVHSLEQWLTDENNHFLVTHMGFLDIDPEHWNLEIGGLVDNPVELNLRDLQAMP